MVVTGTAARRGDDGRGRTAVCRFGGVAGARVEKAGADSRSAAAEQRAAQPPERREQRDPPHTRDPGAAVVRVVTGREFTHQRRRLDGLALRYGGTAEHREMSVEARTGRAAPARDRRDACPAAHCYLFHVTPHPYKSTRPGQTNPIAPSRRACISDKGITFPIRGLTVTLRIQPFPGRVGQQARWWAVVSHREARPSLRVTSRSVRVRRRRGACRRRTDRGNAVSRWGA